MKYRKKPVVIEAIQFTAAAAAKDTFEVPVGWGGVHIFPVRQTAADDPPRRFLLIETLEGTMRADVGDWIICGVHGEFYPCKPDIFAATYEPVM